MRHDNGGVEDREWLSEVGRVLDLTEEDGNGEGRVKVEEGVGAPRDEEEYHYSPVEAIHQASQLIGWLVDRSKGEMKERQRSTHLPFS